VRPIPLAQWYPGDDVVDIVGVDAYDVGVPGGQPRWATIYGRRGGVRDVVRFATAHHKPLSIPEWGVGPAGAKGSGGDDPEYVRGIERVLRDNRIAYQSYFFNAEWAQQLTAGPRSLAVYRRMLAGG
jgi:beta-mannanase